MPSQYRSIYQQTKNPKMHPIIPPPPLGISPTLARLEMNLIYYDILKLQ